MYFALKMLAYNWRMNFPFGREWFLVIIVFFYKKSNKKDKNGATVMKQLFFFKEIQLYIIQGWAELNMYWRTSY